MANVRITATEAGFGPDDDRGLQRVNDLHQELNRYTGAVERRSAVPEPGTKGVLDDVFLVLSSPEVLAGALTVFAAWLARERGSRQRSVRLEWETEGEKHTLDITLENVESATVQAALERVISVQNASGGGSGGGSGSGSQSGGGNAVGTGGGRPG